MSEVEQALGNEIVSMPNSLNLNSIKAIRASPSNEYSESFVAVSEASFKEEILIRPYFSPSEVPKAEYTAGDTTGAIDVISKAPEPSSFTGSSEVPSENEHVDLIQFSLVPRTESTIQYVQTASRPPPVEGQSVQTHSSHRTKARDNRDFIKGLLPQTDNPQSAVSCLDKDIGVIFSLQINNMMFAEDLLNRSSPAYKFLENTFLELVGSLTFFSFHCLYN